MNVLSKSYFFIKRRCYFYYYYKFRALHNTPGMLTIEEGITLFNYSKKIASDEIIIEIGSYKGKSTNFICEGLKNNERAFIVCIDTWHSKVQSVVEDTFSEFCHNTESNGDKIKTIRGYSISVETDNLLTALIERKKVGLVFIDADHSYETVKKEISKYVPYLEKGKYILFHDYNNPCGVKRAVDDAINDGTITKIKEVGSMAVCIKL